MYDEFAPEFTSEEFLMNDPEDEETEEVGEDAEEGDEDDLAADLGDSEEEGI